MTDIRYVDVPNDNAALKSTIHNCIDVANQLYGAARNKDGAYKCWLEIGRHLESSSGHSTTC